MSDDLHQQERDLWGEEPDYGPPRCICGRFTRDWGFCSDECGARAMRDDQDALRRSVEEQGLVGP